jgi:glutaredoxin-related protein
MVKTIRSRRKFMLTLYSTGCPRCQVLVAKLNQAGQDYIVVDSVEEMEALGIMTVPMLKVDDKLLNFSEAVAYVNGLNQK